jgi:isoleucyl-tRNA synthetase
MDDICITSGLTVMEGEPQDDAFRLDDPGHRAWCSTAADGEKCQRCWKILPDVGSHAHPGVCGRCDGALG